MPTDPKTRKTFLGRSIDDPQRPTGLGEVRVMRNPPPIGTRVEIQVWLFHGAIAPHIVWTPGTVQELDGDAFLVEFADERCGGPRWVQAHTPDWRRT